MSEISKLSLISEFISGVAGTEKACLFLGAGADVSSGGVLFKDIKKERKVSFNALSQLWLEQVVMQHLVPAAQWQHRQESQLL